MSKFWRFYDLATGVIEANSRMKLPDAATVAANTPEGCAAIDDSEGAIDPRTMRVEVETGALVPFEAPPPDPERVALSVRTRRDWLLSASDWIVTRSTERGEPVPEAWRAYRDALRDITKQPQFPQVVEWPEAPSDSNY